MIQKPTTQYPIKNEITISFYFSFLNQKCIFTNQYPLKILVKQLRFLQIKNIDAKISSFK